MTRWLQRVGPAVVGLAAIGALLVILKPAQVGRALIGFELTLIPVIVLLYAAIFGLALVSWKALGIGQRLVDVLAAAFHDVRSRWRPTRQGSATSLPNRPARRTASLPHGGVRR